MEISLISDTLTTIATKYGHGLGLSNFVTDRTHYDQQLQIYAIMVPIDAIAPPLVKPRTAPKKLARKRCRVKRSSKTDGDDAYVDEDGGGFFDGGDGPFGGGGGGAGGSGDNFDGLNWDESLPASPSDPAFDFVYEVLCWIVFSNCLHFAFKRVIRILADGVADPERRKVPLRFTPSWYRFLQEKYTCES
ncbi:uncharacterized protein LOC112527825 isoform X1 [Cynara cardunculus var. scolymus]|nr:uncharacterized protein LOC112527825 isoform X1 [Cynara cardunculus var. scolymus]